MGDASAVVQSLRSFIGVESEPCENEIEKGAIAKFAQAIGDDNPLFQNEVMARKSRMGSIVAPPTFLRSLKALPLQAESQIPYKRRLDGGSEWEYFEPVRPGDRITVTTSLKDVSARPGRLGDMLFFVREVKYVNQFGQLVALQRSTLIYY